jgi:hypothetical protein
MDVSWNVAWTSGSWRGERCGVDWKKRAGEDFPAVMCSEPGCFGGAAATDRYTRIGDGRLAVFSVQLWMGEGEVGVDDGSKNQER